MIWAVQKPVGVAAVQLGRGQKHALTLLWGGILGAEPCSEGDIAFVAGEVFRRL